MGRNQNQKLPEMKMTTNGRRPQNIKTGISQQTLNIFSSNLREWDQTRIGSDVPQSLHKSFWDLTKIENCLK